MFGILAGEGGGGENPGKCSLISRGKLVTIDDVDLERNMVNVYRSMEETLLLNNALWGGQNVPPNQMPPRNKRGFK